MLAVTNAINNIFFLNDLKSSEIDISLSL
jgi:hypothetical protein